MAASWYAEGLLGGGDWKYVTMLGEIAEYFDTRLDLIPKLLEKFGQKQDSEHCPVCQHFREVISEFKDCWYCREGFSETEELESYCQDTERFLAFEN